MKALDAEMRVMDCKAGGERTSSEAEDPPAFKHWKATFLSLTCGPAFPAWPWCPLAPCLPVPPCKKMVKEQQVYFKAISKIQYINLWHQHQVSNDFNAYLLTEWPFSSIWTLNNTKRNAFNFKNYRYMVFNVSFTMTILTVCSALLIHRGQSQKKIPI